MRTEGSQIRQSAPPLAHFEDENRVSKHQAGTYTNIDCLHFVCLQILFTFFFQINHCFLRNIFKDLIFRLLN